MSDSKSTPLHQGLNLITARMPLRDLSPEAHREGAQWHRQKSHRLRDDRGGECKDDLTRVSDFSRRGEAFNGGLGAL